MKRNVGGLDSAIRVMIGLALLLAAAGLIPRMAFSIALVVLSLALMWTALAGSCPVYSALGIDTTRADAKGRGGSAPPRDDAVQQ